MTGDPQTPGEGAVPDERPLDPRTRRTWWVAGVGGGGLAVLLAAGVAAGGASGRAGFAAFLLGLAFGSSVAALYALGTAAADVLRGRPVGNSRLWTGGVLFVAAFLLTIMVAGIGG